MLKRIIVISFCLLAYYSLYSQSTQAIHVMVALCDNQYQGIVKVPKGIGNGQDPHTNLYWGCGYGIRTYLKKSADWKEVKRYKVDDIRLERIVFKHKTKNFYLVADAYDGKNIKECTIDFLNSCSGAKKDTLMVGNTVIGLNGNAKLVSYIGHNGLMDFSLQNTYQSKDDQKRDAIILACASKQYFAPYLRSAKVNPLLWTTHLMCPEAYTLHDAIDTYINGGDDAAVRISAATAYNKYQKCGLNGAKRLLVTGF
ncbi:hypothetical protein [Dysgonomonas sp. ZJ279]|uniref:hypothetical protein n=1 Tax=Dysgonomonas sp. ZJ279 TaxID=2709796 RepID=UPI0013EAA7FA|nr:hypothetical protein [Dysgonomonas sp. ZJ279]